MQLQNITFWKFIQNTPVTGHQLLVSYLFPDTTKQWVLCVKFFLRTQGKSEGKVYYDWSVSDHDSNNQLSICIQNCVFSLQVEGTQPSAGWSTCLCTLSCTSTISWPPLESGMTVDQPSTGSSLKKNSVQSSTGSPLISLFFCNFYIFDIFRHKKKH